MCMSAMWLTICACYCASVPESACWAANLNWRSFCRAEVPIRVDLMRGAAAFAFVAVEKPFEPRRLSLKKERCICTSFGFSAVSIISCEPPLALLLLKKEFWVPLKRSLRRRSCGTDRRAQVRRWCSSNIYIAVFCGLPCLW